MITKEQVLAEYLTGYYDRSCEKEVNLTTEDYRTIINALNGVKSGRWERHWLRPGVYEDLYWHCSECGYKNGDNWGHKYKFCPGCGARMEEGVERYGNP